MLSGNIIIIAKPPIWSKQKCEHSVVTRLEPAFNNSFGSESVRALMLADEQVLCLEHLPAVGFVLRKEVSPPISLSAHI